jgi:hypothetical protein
LLLQACLLVVRKAWSTKIRCVAKERFLMLRHLMHALPLGFELLVVEVH